MSFRVLLTDRKYTEKLNPSVLAAAYHVPPPDISLYFAFVLTPLHHPFTDPFMPLCLYSVSLPSVIWNDRDSTSLLGFYFIGVLYVSKSDM